MGGPVAEKELDDGFVEETGFRLTPKQGEARDLMASGARHILLVGGSRSGKTFIAIRNIVLRALMAPGSRHGVFRKTFASLRASIINDTFPKVMDLCFPGVRYKIDRQEWVCRFAEGREIWFAGLDEGPRTEKILGMEFATLYLNEASEVSFGSRNMLLTRLAQRTSLRTREWIDANPPSTSHWLYSLFVKHCDPSTGEPQERPDDYAHLLMNPDSNRDNLDADYIRSLEGLPERARRRFLYGEWTSSVPNSLWQVEYFSYGRKITEESREIVLDSMARVVIGVDPSGCSSMSDVKADAIGIVVAGKGHNGKGYILSDSSLRASPYDWVNLVVRLYHMFRADRIVVEKNYGGAVVEAMFRSVSQNLPLVMVSASRGKHVRAEPVSAMYEASRILHCGPMPDLEDQYCQFTTDGWLGSGSPDRADAAIFALTDLFLANRTAAPKLAKTNKNFFGR